MINFECEINAQFGGQQSCQGYQGGLASLFEQLVGSISSQGYYSNCRPPDENGWSGYIGSYPPSGVLLQFGRRIKTVQTECGYIYQPRWVGYADFHPEFNVANLYWRLTGIGKYQLGAA